MKTLWRAHGSLDFRSKVHEQMFHPRHSATTLHYSLSLSSSLFLSYPLHASSRDTSMSRNSMASTSSSSPPPNCHDRKKLDVESIRLLVISVNQHILQFLTDPDTRKSLRLRCTSKLKIQKQEFFEFSEQSVMSNLFWGIENVEAAIQSRLPEERASRLKDSEQMLQVPALLDEHGTTGGIPNRHLVCYSYFYLSLVRKLQQDEWQVALHFLQALLVSPRLVRLEFATNLWENIFLSQIMSRRSGVGGWRRLHSERLVDYSEDTIDEATRQLARRYKNWLMYYQVTLYGETHKLHWGCSVASPMENESRDSMYGKSTGTRYMDSIEHGTSRRIYQDLGKVYPLDLQEHNIDEMVDKAMVSTFSSEKRNTHLQDDSRNLLKKLKEIGDREIKMSLGVKCLQDMLEESQSATPTSVYSFSDSDEESDSEEKMDISEISDRIVATNTVDSQPENGDRMLQSFCSTSNPECVEITPPEYFECLMHEEIPEINTNYFFSTRSCSPIEDLNLSDSELRDIYPHTFCNCHMEEIRRKQYDFGFCGHMPATYLQRCCFTTMDNQEASAKRSPDSNIRNSSEVFLHKEEDNQMEILGIFEKAVSTLSLLGEEGKCKNSADSGLEWGILTNRKETEFRQLKDVILDQLINTISNSKEEGIIRASMSMLSTLISENRSVIEDIKIKGLHLCDLASALKRNVHEAAILIYLINPSPTEIKDLELLPALLDIVCNSNRYKQGSISLMLTPPAASLMMIEVLVTAFDYATNNMHLATISSPQILSKLIDVATYKSLDEFISLAHILVKCMRFDGNCRNFLSQCNGLDQFISLLRSQEKHAKFAALEFFQEILQMPRSSAISLLHRIRQTGSLNIMHVLVSGIQQLQPRHRLLAANLLLQLDMLEEPSGKSIFREEAMEVLLESIAYEESFATQILSASILSNVGGTYAWTGESYTVAWLLKRAGLTSLCHWNMIKNVDWLDHSLQDDSIDPWCSKVARSMIKIGNPVFHALEKGLQSKIKSVSRDCLTAIAWLGCEIADGPTNLKFSACEILLNRIEQFLHPGLEMEERLLACLCIYNYASGRGMKKLIHLSEGVRESLRRLSSVTWMAEQLLKVTDYFQPITSRVSCVHTQILEASQNCSGAANALIYYKGQLFSGYSDGSIKVWHIKGQRATLVWDIKKHKKAVTCFALFEPGNSLLSGSSDKTIRVWQIIQRKLECVEVIETKEPVCKIDTSGQLIFVLAQSRGIKVFDESRKMKVICNNRHVKCISVIQGKFYVGCLDSSIQEVDIMSNREREIKAPGKSWLLQKKPINALLAYKDWLYSGSSNIEGLNFKEQRRLNKPQMSITTEKGAVVQAMAVVEDFIYLTCSSSPSILQIWLRSTQKKIGGLSAGSKITSLLTANDIVLCGTETGLIKGWIPL